MTRRTVLFGSLAWQGTSLREPVMFGTPEADRILSTLQVFPSDNAWNRDISGLPVHPNSDRLVASVGADKTLEYNLDMNFILVPPDQRRVPVKLVAYPAESDPGPYPVPDNAPIENWPLAVNEDRRALPRPGQTLDDFQRHGEGDRHMLIVDPGNGKLYEFYRAYKTDAGWQADCEATFDLRTGKLRPPRWTSSDAAGLPVFPATVRYDECERGLVGHAMRFTIQRTRAAYVSPATHYASRSQDPNLPRMGERFRLKRGFDTAPFPRHARAILEGLKKFGMFVADNGGDWRLSISPDRRLQGLETLARLRGSDFEVVDTGALPSYGCVDDRRELRRGWRADPRTSLALALVTGTPFRMINVRCKREKPGLRRQQLTAVRAAAKIGGAEVEGAAVNSGEIVFRPGKVRGGAYRFDVGTAGSTTLVFQTILPALIACGEAAQLEFLGGTHNHGGPRWDFLDLVFLPAIRRMGANVKICLERHGFAPAGGGRWSATIAPSELSRLDLHQRGAPLWRKGRALVSNLPESIGEREIAVVQSKLNWPDEALSAERVDAFGPGNIVMLAAAFEGGATELTTGFGRRGYAAEKVAADAVECWRAYELSGAPVGEHLADQLLLPLALGEGGSLTTIRPTAHTATNIDTIRRFLDVAFRVEQVNADTYRVGRT